MHTACAWLSGGLRTRPKPEILRISGFRLKLKSHRVAMRLSLLSTFIDFRYFRVFLFNSVQYVLFPVSVAVDWCPATTRARMERRRSSRGAFSGCNTYFALRAIPVSDVAVVALVNSW